MDSVGLLLLPLLGTGVTRCAVTEMGVRVGTQGLPCGLRDVRILSCPRLHDFRRITQRLAGDSGVGTWTECSPTAYKGRGVPQRPHQVFGADSRILYGGSTDSRFVVTQVLAQNLLREPWILDGSDLHDEIGVSDCLGQRVRSGLVAAGGKKTHLGTGMVNGDLETLGIALNAANGLLDGRRGTGSGLRAGRTLGFGLALGLHGIFVLLCGGSDLCNTSKEGGMLPQSRQW